MRLAARRLGLGMLFLLGIACWSAGVSEASSGLGSSSVSAFGGGLVVPGVQRLDEGQQMVAQREAQRVNPEAVAERAASRTRFSGLTATQARELAGEAFPAVVEDPEGGLPRFSGVRRVAGFPSDRAASLILDSGRHAVLDSMSPIAVNGSSGQRLPINLALVATGGGFAPVTPLVQVRLPRRISEGATLGSTGVSLTPVSAGGGPLGGSEGVLDGATVLYANTQRDSDTIFKPVTFGFEADTLLRSANSPEMLFYRVGLPAGGRLVQHAGSVDVVVNGAPVATVPAPIATDAEGSRVPVEMRVSKDALALSVRHRAGSYRYPILVDPWLENYIERPGKANTNWVFQTTNEHVWRAVKTEKETVELESTAAFKGEEHAVLNYSTQGDSVIGGAQVVAEGTRTAGAEPEALIISGLYGNESTNTERWQVESESHDVAFQYPSCHHGNGCPNEEEWGRRKTVSRLGCGRMVVAAAHR